MDWPCIAEYPEGVILSLKVSPNASKTEACGLWQDRLRLRVQAPPVEGKANEAIKKWAGKVFGIRAGSVEMLRGERGSMKQVLLRGIDRGKVAEILDREQD